MEAAKKDAVVSNGNDDAATKQVNGTDPAKVEIKIENDLDDLQVVDEAAEDNEDQEDQDGKDNKLDTTREHPHKAALDAFDFMALNTQYSVFGKMVKNMKKPRPVNPKDIVEIKTKALLTEISEHLMSRKYLSIDLEFYTHGYEHIVALIQIGTAKEIYLIDAIALKDDLHILSEVFLNPKSTKIFHGAQKDLRWLQCEFGLYVCNMFDTLAAMKMLHYDDPSLRGYLAKNCKIFIDKIPQSANFRQRPLTQTLKISAATQVHYLYYVYVYLRMQLAKVGLFDVFLEKCHQTCYELFTNNTNKYEIEQVFTNINSLRPDQLEAAKNLNEWRKKLGQKIDMNCGYILSKKHFRYLIQQMPTTKESLMKFTNSTHVKSNVQEVLKIFQEAAKLAPPSVEKDATTTTEETEETEENATTEKTETGEEKNFEPETIEQVINDTSVLNETQIDILTKLNDWRNRVSLKIHKSPSAVLPRNILRIVVIRNPTSKKELLNICRNIYVKAYIDELLKILGEGRKKPTETIKKEGDDISTEEQPPVEGAEKTETAEGDDEEGENAVVKEETVKEEDIMEQCKTIFEDLSELSQIQTNLLKDLLYWRNKLARRNNINPENILNKTHLRKLIIQMPTDRKLIKTICYSPYVEAYCNEVLTLLLRANESSGKRVVTGPPPRSPQKPGGERQRPFRKPDSDKKFGTSFNRNRDRKRKFPFREERGTKNPRLNRSSGPSYSGPYQKPNINIWDKPTNKSPLPSSPIWQLTPSQGYSRRSEPSNRYDYPKSNVGSYGGQDYNNSSYSNYGSYRDTSFRDGNTRTDINSSGNYGQKPSYRGNYSSPGRFGGNKSRGGWGSKFQGRSHY